MADLLSKDIWAIIMTYLPQAERLGACSLVCRKIRAAAAEATRDVSVVCVEEDEEDAEASQQQRVDGMGRFLQHHGQQVTSLAFKHNSFSKVSLPELPCARLRSLDIRSTYNGRLKVHLDPTSDFSGVVHTCTALTRLKLGGCVLASDSADPLASLSLLVNLVDLKLVALRVRRTGAAFMFCTFPGSILPCLSRLTCLELSDVDVDDVHCVSQLQHLCVLSIKEVPAEQQPLRLSGFVLPASVQHIALCGIVFNSHGVVLDTAVSAAATLLSRLELVYMDVEGEAGMLQGVALLEALSKLQRLEFLSLHGLSFDASAWPPVSAAYEALTASSVLRTLHFFTRVPDAFWLHAFSPTRSFKLETFENAGIMSVEAMSRVVACCSQLSNLDVLVRGAPVCQALKPLTGLTKLRIYISDDESERGINAGIQALAALTTLHDLSIQHLSDPLPVSSLLPLTALRALNSCTVRGQFDWRSDDEAETPIWLRLVKRCMQDTSCQPAIKASLQQELAQLQQQEPEEVHRGGAEEEQRQTLQRKIEELLEQLQEGV